MHFDLKIFDRDGDLHTVRALRLHFLLKNLQFTSIFFLNTLEKSDLVFVRGGLIFILNVFFLALEQLSLDFFNFNGLRFHLFTHFSDSGGMLLHLKFGLSTLRAMFRQLLGFHVTLNRDLVDLLNMLSVALFETKELTFQMLLLSNDSLVKMLALAQFALQF